MCDIHTRQHTHDMTRTFDAIGWYSSTYVPIVQTNHATHACACVCVWTFIHSTGHNSQPLTTCDLAGAGPTAGGKYRSSSGATPSRHCNFGHSVVAAAREGVVRRASSTGGRRRTHVDERLMAPSAGPGCRSNGAASKGGVLVTVGTRPGGTAAVELSDVGGPSVHR